MKLSQISAIVALFAASQVHSAAVSRLCALSLLSTLSCSQVIYLTTI